eukprot:symbB.v1.2.016961.t1/scaffold1308.1/size125923/7
MPECSVLIHIVALGPLPHAQMAEIRADCLRLRHEQDAQQKSASEAWQVHKKAMLEKVKDLPSLSFRTPREKKELNQSCATSCEVLRWTIWTAMAPSRGVLASILGTLAGLLCVFVTDPNGPLFNVAKINQVEILLPPSAGRPILVVTDTGQLMVVDGWTIHTWQDCPLTGIVGCHICMASPSETAGVEAVSTTKPPPYVLNAGKDGLPIAEGKRPSWLVKEDELSIDARKPPGHGGILIVQPVLMDATSTWGHSKAARPRWLRAILATNRNHARIHGHCVILRWQPTQPQLTKWQRRGCGKMDEKTCTRNNERENFNWEKHLMLYEYLLSPQNFTHVLMLDADAALVKHSVDILGDIAKAMEKRNLDVFLTSEDWLLNGENRINGGFLMTRNSEWSQNLFQDTFRAHVIGPGGLRKWRIGVSHQECSSNEQICLNDIMSGSNKEHVKGHMSLESGIIYNRGGCTVKHCGEPITDPKMEALGMRDERMQVLHFMGGSKPLAPVVLCVRADPEETKERLLEEMRQRERTAREQKAAMLQKIQQTPRRTFWTPEEKELLEARKHLDI